MNIKYVAMETKDARALQAGAADANGMAPERHISDGDGVPCRHCLRNVEKGAPCLVLAWRPFPAPQPYAEVGPIFLHAEPCERAPLAETLPEFFRASPDWIVRGYGLNNRIVYGTGSVVKSPEVNGRAQAIFEDPQVAYLHMRSARNNCFQCRIERA